MGGAKCLSTLDLQTQSFLFPSASRETVERRGNSCVPVIMRGMVHLMTSHGLCHSGFQFFLFLSGEVGWSLLSFHIGMAYTNPQSLGSEEMEAKVEIREDGHQSLDGDASRCQQLERCTCSLCFHTRVWLTKQLPE